MPLMALPFDLAELRMRRYQPASPGPLKKYGRQGLHMWATMARRQLAILNSPI